MPDRPSPHRVRHRTLRRHWQRLPPPVRAALVLMAAVGIGAVMAVVVGLVLLVWMAADAGLL